MNRLTKKQFTRIAVCAIATLAITACSSEEITPQDKQQQKTEKAVATFTGSQPNNDSDVPTRPQSLTHLAILQKYVGKHQTKCSLKMMLAFTIKVMQLTFTTPTIKPEQYSISILVLTL